MAKVKTPRWGWALTGSGHFFKECLTLIAELDDVDLFVSKAAAEVVRMYRQELKLPKSARLFQDKTASAAPVGAFYYGDLPHAGGRTGDVEHGREMRVRHFRHAGDQRVRAGR